MERANPKSAAVTGEVPPLNPLPFAPFELALFLTPILTGSLDLVWGLVLSALIWLSLLLRVVWPGQPPLRLPRVAWLALLFPAAAVVSLIGSAHPGATVVTILLYTGYAVAFLLSLDLTARGGIGWLLGPLLAGGLVVAGWGLREYGIEFREGVHGWRSFSTFINPNYFAGYVAPCLLLTLGLAFRRPASFRGSTWLLALVLLTAAISSALLVTASRGAFLSTGAGLVVFVALAAFRRELRASEARMRLAVVGAILLIAFAAFSTTLRERANNAAPPPPITAELCPIQTKGEATDSNQFRRLTWKSSIRMGKARPITGWGAGAYEFAFAPFEIAGYTRQAHNSFLQYFAEEGVVGVLAFLLVLGATAVAVLRLPRESDAPWVPAAAGAVVAVLAHNLFDSTLFAPAVASLTWSLLGALVARPATGQPEPAPLRSARTNRAGVPDRFRGAWIAACVAALVATGWVTLGRWITVSAETGVTVTNAADAVDTLKTARAMLPWDPDVYLALTRTYPYLGLSHLDDAITAANRALELEPYRMPTYFWIGQLRKTQGRPDMAYLTYQQGLTHQPHEVQLLYAEAQTLTELRQDPLPIYRTLAAVEDSPIAQVNALGEFQDYRFARARMALARAADRDGDHAGATAQRLRAACLLAERRVHFTNRPESYVGFHDWSRDTERQLRTDEETLWSELSKSYRAGGDAHRADLAAQQAKLVDASRDDLERIIRQIQNADPQQSGN